ncbi:MAG: hypothetical protein WCI71_12905 [Bacteroidota bacterium]
MKRFTTFLLTAQFMFIFSPELFSQSGPGVQEFGLNAGAFTNFPANQNYLKDNMSVFYVAPYLRMGQHEFSAGLLYPVKAQSMIFTEEKINPRLGAVAGYKFYVFDAEGRENLFIHYSFQYLRFSGSYDKDFSTDHPVHITETDMYINNVIGLGYNLFFDMNARFGLYYTLDYVISQTSIRLGAKDSQNYWTTQYVWNNISTNIGFIFKITSLKKKAK